MLSVFLLVCGLSIFFFGFAIVAQWSSNTDFEFSQTMKPENMKAIIRNFKIIWAIALVIAAAIALIVLAVQAA